MLLLLLFEEVSYLLRRILLGTFDSRMQSSRGDGATVPYDLRLDSTGGAVTASSRR